MALTPAKSKKNWVTCAPEGMVPVASSYQPFLGAAAWFAVKVPEVVRMRMVAELDAMRKTSARTFPLSERVLLTVIGAPAQVIFWAVPADPDASKATELLSAVMGLSHPNGPNPGVPA